MKCKICGIKEGTFHGYCERCDAMRDRVDIGIVRCNNCEKTAEVLTKEGSYCEDCAKRRGREKVQFT